MPPSIEINVLYMENGEGERFCTRVTAFISKAPEGACGAVIRSSGLQSGVPGLAKLPQDILLTVCFPAFQEEH